MRRRPLGPTVSVAQRCTDPSGSVTSNQNQACGFCQSTLTSVPLITTDFVTSNCAFTAWCASAAETYPTARPIPAIAATTVALRINLFPSASGRAWKRPVFQPFPTMAEEWLQTLLGLGQLV